MRVRGFFLAAFAFTGCQSLPLPVPVAEPAAAVAAQLPGARAAVSSEPDDPLALAAKCLERGDHPMAATHLGAYVRAHPDQIMFRAHLAELLVKAGRDADAKAHFETFVADAQAATGPPRDHLVQCHTRLMEIAQRADDRFGELFHRAAGLLLIVREQDKVAAARDEEFREEVLCQVLKTLAAAKELRPTDPRVHVYLAEAHDRAGNRRAADVARAAARNLTAPGTLTPPEQRRLALAR